MFALPDTRHVEVFAEDHLGNDHFDTRPVVGFAVSDLAAAVTRLRAAGIELVGEPGPTWQHFRDGESYELGSD